MTDAERAIHDWAQDIVHRVTEEAVAEGIPDATISRLVNVDTVSAIIESAILERYLANPDEDHEAKLAQQVTAKVIDILAALGDHNVSRRKLEERLGRGRARPTGGGSGDEGAT